MTTDTGNTSSNTSQWGQRRDYIADSLRRDQLAADPIDQFSHWLKDARDKKIIDATAMVLSTVDPTGAPHSRVVLLKHVDTDGFTFYTNYLSDKGNELAGNPKACLLFYWRDLERQVRIEGVVSKLPGAIADEYFHSRPEGSRFSAAASRQSQRVHDRTVLEKDVADLQQRYPDGNIPRPDHWGGYQLKPSRLEFWQGRADRLHDRFQYNSGNANAWQIDRLSP